MRKGEGFVRFSLGGPNGLLPLVHQNRVVTESFGKSEISGPKHFCDLCRKLPCHGNSDHLMSFKKSFHASHFCDLYRRSAGTEIISEAPFFIFGFSDFLISEAGVKKRPERRSLGPPKVFYRKNSSVTRSGSCSERRLRKLKSCSPHPLPKNQLLSLSCMQRHVVVTTNIIPVIVVSLSFSRISLPSDGSDCGCSSLPVHHNKFLCCRSSNIAIACAHHQSTVHIAIVVPPI